MFAALAACQRLERPALDITGYVIDAEIDTATHHLAAKATVTFTAPENSEEVSFGFHPALKVTKITDETGKVLTGERHGRRHHPRHAGHALRRGPAATTGPSSTTAPSPATKMDRSKG